jgi:single-stranded DNA-binding protein
MTGTLLGNSITGWLTSEPELIAHAQVQVATFTIEEHHSNEAETYEVFAYGSLARECVKNLSYGQTVTIEGRLTERAHELSSGGERVAGSLVANRVWLNHLRLLVA